MKIEEFGEKIPGIDYKERKAVYAVMVSEDDKVAIIETPRGYFLPGGGLEKDESLEQCLRREMLEEAGHDILIKEFIGCAINYEYSPRMKRYLKGIGYFYAASLGDKFTEETEEDHELVWISSKVAANSMVMPHQSWAIKKCILKGENQL